MITFTKEQLIASAHARIEFAEMMLAGELEPLKERTWSIELELARIALASLEAEPVCVIDQSNLDYLKSGSDADVWPASRTEMGDVLLYRAAPPAPVAVPDDSAITQHFDTIALETAREIMCDVSRRHEFLGGEVQLLSRIQCRIDDACRAAMLHGADGKPELTVWYGAMPETNGKTNWTAMLHRKGHHPWEGITIDRSEYPGRVRYEADRMRHLIGELADEPDILTYDSDAHSGYVEPVTTAYKLRDAVETIRNSGIKIDAEKIFAERDALNAPDCWCRACRPITLTDMRFVVCPDCGNKRCPHANDHRNACSGSNEPGQEGSAYPAAPQQEV